MSSARKIKANRANSRFSTGPNTAQGKTHAAQNARSHGLSVSVLLDRCRSAEAENLAREIAGEGPTHKILSLARRVAEAQIDLIRIRQARHDLLSRDLNDPEFRPRSYFKDADATIKMVAGGPDAVLPPPVAELADHTLHWKPQGAEKLAHIVSDLAPKLAALDRYEGRALSRRKFAIRALDMARAKATALGSVP